MKKNILILYTNYGTGHYMAAKALEEHVKTNYKNYNVQLLDPLSYSRPIINKLFAKVGNIVSTKFRKFRGKLYKKEMYQNYLKNSYFFTFCTKLFWTKKLHKKITDFNPNIIISTQVGPTGLIAAHKNLFDIKLISVFTDYGLHRMYTVAHELIDIFCVPNKDIEKQMINIGITKEKPILLFICGGGLGYSNAFTYFEKMLQTNYDFSYIFISGRNNNLAKKATKIASKYNKHGKVLGYVENIDEFIKSSTLVLGKPGGIVTSETLNSEVPLCAIEPIPGQETNNALFISNNQFGFYITSIKNFEIFLETLKTNKINLDNYKKNIKNKFQKFNFIDLKNI